MANTKITSRVLADDAVLTANITDANVTTAKIAADAITGAKIADDAINSEHYTDGSIDTAHIADAQITTAKITDANVTTAKIADDAITTAKIADDVALGGNPTTTTQTSGNNTTRIATTAFVTTALSSISSDSLSDADSDTKIQVEESSDEDKIRFDTGGTERMIIDDSGRLGLGTSSPDNIFHIHDGSAGSVSAYADSHLIIETAQNNNFLTFLSPADKNQGILFGDADANYRGQVQYNHNGDNMLFHTAAGERMRIDSSGKVGIGTTSPSAELHIATSSGDCTVLIEATENSAAREPHLQLRSYNTSGNPIIEFGDHGGFNGSIEYENQDNSLRFSANAGERMRIDSSGAVGIGTTSPDDHVTIDGGSDVHAILNLRSQSIGTTYNGGTLRFKGYHANPSDGSRIWFEIRGQKENNTGGDTKGRIEMYINPGTNSMTEVMKIESNGDMYTNDGTVHSLASDSRVKSDVADLTDGLTILNQLRPVTYKYNTKSEFYNPVDETTTRYGFIADEVKAVAPQYIKEGEGKVDGVEVDDFKTLSQTKMIPMLVKAIQEQQTIIDDLKARIETLEG